MLWGADVIMVRAWMLWEVDAPGPERYHCQGMDAPERVGNAEARQIQERQHARTPQRDSATTNGSGSKLPFTSFSLGGSCCAKIPKIDRGRPNTIGIFHLS